MDIEDLAPNSRYPKMNVDKIKSILHDINDIQYTERKQYQAIMRQMNRKYHCSFSKNHYNRVYKSMIECGELEENQSLLRYMRRKSCRSHSGVLVITVVTSPYPETRDEFGNITKQRFSCPKNCYYCPAEPGQPRSYLKSEPAVARANKNEFDAIRQFNDRATILQQNGHMIDKIEIIVLGGTWSCYPHDYQERFVADLFYAANMWGKKQKRDPRNLIYEQLENETASSRIIGLTLETRPDYIDVDEIRRFRRYGCTRVQIGVQHTHDDVLEYINRQSTREDAVQAIRLLKDNCFKVDIHLMPDLPGSSPEKDREMFEEVLTHPDFQVDHHKWYPTAVVDHTQIKRWYEQGTYRPYADIDGGRILFELLAEMYQRVPRWVRVNRIFRDIPKYEIIGGCNRPNLRQDLDTYMKDNGLHSNEIRSREVKINVIDMSKTQLFIRSYLSSGGMEYFISVEEPFKNLLLGFVRLRLTDATKTPNIEELRDCALIRELHVYGTIVKVAKGANDRKVQHLGIGKRLMNVAEGLAIEKGYKKIAVISGIGVRNYYRKIGYEKAKTYMVKRLDTEEIQNRMFNFILGFYMIIMVGLVLISVFNFCPTRPSNDHRTLSYAYPVDTEADYMGGLITIHNNLG
jgi:ELP3 family radical SAM enzyme/protein acetyltransferase